MARKVCTRYCGPPVFANTFEHNKLVGFFKISYTGYFCRLAHQLQCDFVMHALFFIDE